MRTIIVIIEEPFFFDGGELLPGIAVALAVSCGGVGVGVVGGDLE